MKSKLLILFYLFLTTLLSGWTIHDKDFNIDIHLSDTQVMVNGELDVEVMFHHPPSYFVKTDELIQHLLWHINPLEPTWHLVRYDVSKPRPGTTRLQVTITPLKEGVFDLSFFDIAFYSSQDDSKRIYSTPLFEIKAAIPSFSSMEFGPTAPLIGLESPFPFNLDDVNQVKMYDQAARRQESAKIQNAIAFRTFPWTFLFAVTMGSLFFLMMRYYKPFRPKPKEQVLKSASENALSGLEIIKRADLTTKGEFKKFFTDLTEVLRNYLQSSFDISVVSQTTSELQKELEQHRILSSELEHRMLHFLTLADQVKFANKVPAPDECDEAYTTVEAIVNDVK